MKKLFSASCMIALLFFAQSCTKDFEDLYTGDYTSNDFDIISAQLNLPANVIDYNERPVENPFGSFSNHSNEEVTLGRVLFYDKTLASAGEISCASCHAQESGFSDNVAFSEGVRGEVTLRNSIALGQFASFDSEYGGGGPGNFGSSQPLFWDGRATSVHDQILETMSNPIEMDIDVNELVHRLRDSEVYQILFKRAYGEEAMSSEKVVQAMEAFMRTLESNDTKFDQGLFEHGDALVEFSNLTNSENRGKELFAQKCGSCHGSTINSPFSINSFEDAERFANNGLDLQYQDAGLGIVTNVQSDFGKFKVPQLRNVAKTGPYMHDGRFETLEDVVDFYSTGIQSHANLSHNLHAPGNFGQAVKMNFTDQQKSDLVNFMNTLTDDFLLSDVRWSDPFKI